ncbi:MAG: DUF6986 family protein, partial [Nocardioidaceae bacterium]
MSIDDLAARLDAHLERADAALAAAYPGERAGRQPVHTVYGPADRFEPGTVPAWGREALAAVAAHPQAWAALGVADDVADRVRAKLEVAPVEDLRVDFADGYGTRPDAAEDAAAGAAATALAATVHDGTAAPFHGIRFKSF